MKKTRKVKLFFLLLLTIVMLSMTVLQVGASRGIGGIDEIVSIEVFDMSSVTFYHCENTSPEMALRFENSILGISVDIAEMAAAYSYSFWCMIFGHNWVRRTTIIVEHRVYSTSPRCRETRVCREVCSRDCGNDVIVGMTSSRIFCC